MFTCQPYRDETGTYLRTKAQDKLLVCLTSLNLCFYTSYLRIFINVLKCCNVNHPDTGQAFCICLKLGKDNDFVLYWNGCNRSYYRAYFCF